MGDTLFEDHFVTQRDGLRLHARHYRARGGRQPGTRTALCLPGLSRNGRDFHELALGLSAPPFGRDVYTLDLRGRGLSQTDPDWRNYAVPIEAQDVVDVMSALGLADAAMIGTSRGGLISMVLGALQPGLIGSVVLNDIGPVIEMKGLSRIASYVGSMPLPRTWEEAAALVRDMNARAFPAVAEREWEPIARQLFNEKDGRPAPGYDPAIGRSLSALDGPMPALWAQFDTLLRVPMLVIRGSNSDILSAETVEAMRERHPDFAELTVAGQGHAPFLRDEASIAAVRQFLQRADTTRKAQAA